MALENSFGLDKPDVVLSSGSTEEDPEQCRWPAYEEILTQSLRWSVDKRPIIVSEGDPRLSQWPTLAANSGKWMEDAKRIAIGNHRQVLEDGPDVCDSESDNDYSENSDVLEGMYTEGASLSSARLTTEQSNALRAQSERQSVQEPEQRQPTKESAKKKSGRAGRLVTDWGKG
jgi:hypothetical protein